MLIGEEIINDAFNSWLEKYGFDTRVKGLELDFAWCPATDEIVYQLISCERTDKMFMDYAYELGLLYEIDAFWLGFLHELGHSETWHLVDEEDWDVPVFLEHSEDYYRLPRETIATQWAVDFVNNCGDAVAELTRIVGPAIRRFFEINNIEEGDLYEG